MDDKNFENIERDYVRVRAEYQARVQNMVLNRGQRDVLRGAGGVEFRYAWKDRNEGITPEEFDQYGVDEQFDGGTITFGAPAGFVPIA
ncbi:hypothetical protein FJ945_19640 [Mesorhizobium sp. B2-4-9]|uniref:hypothetical protein n=1 Tax=Mesorhizobium sp. B2-4-9 TaxID=2589940 RepID=UPI00112B8B07|nr:hypothetical protein [Mesorhizobium sp. B2-4-9]TPL20960.1 hypothetical protein FJ945_19640 [Mesorhizobium sp. B2-4-9]